MPLRIGFDMDGVLADFDAAFRTVERSLFGAEPSLAAGDPATEPEAEPAAEGEEAGPRAAATPPTPADFLAVREQRRRRDLVWNVIRSTPDFWTTLQPLDPGAVRRIQAATVHHKWEVFFITQRPYTDGETVQRQTQRWLVAQGFDLPSVLVIAGSRGAAAGALRLDYHVDDSPQNCLDVLSDSTARPILVTPDHDANTIAQARKLRIGTAASIGVCLDLLEQASAARNQPRLMEKLAALIGWK